MILLKPNLSELCSLTGHNTIEATVLEAAARQLIDKNYCEIAVVSLGPQGAMLVSRQEQIMVNAPIVKKVSTVGAGDSMVAGMTWMLDQQRPLAEVLQFGVACGTAATMNPGTALFKKRDALRLFEQLSRQKSA